MVDIAANITEFRKRCGYTQKELADKIGVSVQTVSKWENSISAPDISMLSPLASAFSITVDTLIGCDTGTDCVTPSRAYEEAVGLIIARVRMFFGKGLRPENAEEKRKCVDVIKEQLKEHPSWETGLGKLYEKCLYYSPDTGFIGIDDVGKKLFTDETEELFVFLSSKVNREILNVMYEYGGNRYISLEYIAEKVGAETGEISRCIDFLCDKAVITKTSFPTENQKNVDAYRMSRPEGTRGFIMLRAITAFAKKFMQKPEFFCSYLD